MMGRVSNMAYVLGWRQIEAIRRGSGAHDESFDNAPQPDIPTSVAVAINIEMP